MTPLPAPPPILSAASRRAYEHDIAEYAEWCGAHSLAALPASEQTLADYAQYLATEARHPREALRPFHRVPPGKSEDAVKRALWAIGVAHAQAGVKAPDQRKARGIAKQYGR